MLLVIFILSIVIPITWFVLKNRKYYIGTENRHRFFAEYFKDFPIFHNGKTMDQKRKLFEPLQQMGKNLRILEIGAGPGANFQFYPESTLLTVVDPNPFFRKYLEDGLSKNPHVKLEKCVISGAEDMKGVPDHSIDVVVSTLVLCSVNDMHAVYKEIQRVLVPGGKFFFMEHVVDDKLSFIKLIQVIGSFVGLFQFLFDGCRNDKDIEKEIRKAGFAKVDAKRFRLDLKEGVPLAFWGVYTIEPHLYGTAITKNN